VQFLLHWDKKRQARRAAEEGRVNGSGSVTPPAYDDKAYEAENPDQKVLA